ncbi:MAG: hypothetical protein KBD06_03215 [Candidatus Pacebacteria bacterium]|nr:hypothetical protein [Candidatus Paceibacterota bacterium]
MRSTLSRIGGLFISRSVLFLMSVFFAFACIGALSAHADTNNMPCSGAASSSSSALDCVSTPTMRVNVRDVFDEISRARSESASTTSSVSGSTTSTSTIPGGIAGIFDNIPDIGDLIDRATSTATSTSGLGAQIADSITQSGGISGNGTSAIGPFVKCVLLQGMGWPIPTYSSECPPPGGTTTPNSTRVVLVKNTIGGEGAFGFTIAGTQSGTTTVTTSGNTATVQFLVNPGSFTISEDALGAGWTQTGRVCISNATTTGAVSGALGWQFTISSGDTVTCTFTNMSSTTPGGGGGCTENCGGGGCVSNCGGGGTPSGGVSSGGGGGGGGNGPISTAGPVLGGGGFSPGEVLGNTIEMPGVPNTGAGDSTDTRLILLYSGFAMLLGASYIVLARKKI